MKNLVEKKSIVDNSFVNYFNEKLEGLCNVSIITDDSGTKLLAFYKKTPDNVEKNKFYTIYSYLCDDGVYLFACMFSPRGFVSSIDSGDSYLDEGDFCAFYSVREKSKYSIDVFLNKKVVPYLKKHFVSFSKGILLAV